MRQANVYQRGVLAGSLRELPGTGYEFVYAPDFQGAPVSLTMPVRKNAYHFKSFPPFFEGLLPEGYQLESLLRQAKLDKSDYFSQLIQVGADLVGSVTVFPS